MWRVAAASIAAASGYLGYRVYEVQSVEAAQAASGMNGSLMSRFSRFASVVRGAAMEGESQSFMTAADFIRSCCVPCSENDNNTSVSRSEASLFQLLDADGDGVMSFQEYCVLFTMLSTDDAMFRTAFHMFDRDENGALDANEFATALNALCVDPSVGLEKLSLSQSGIAKHFFGPKLDRSLALSDFLTKMNHLRWEVRRMEFKRHQKYAAGGAAALPSDTDSVAPLASSQSADTSTSSSWFRWGKKRSNANEVISTKSSTKVKEGDEGSLPLSRVRAIFLGSEPSEPPATHDDGALLVPWSSYVRIYDIIREAPQIRRGMNLVLSAKEKRPVAADDATADGAAQPLGVTPSEFARVLRAVNLERTLSSQDIDLCFRIFDIDGSGTLDPTEFEKICSLRQSFFALHQPKFTEPKRNAVQQFVACMQQRTE